MVTVGLLLVAMGGGGLLVHAWPGFYRWLRAGRRMEQCCLCGEDVKPRRVHTIVTRPSDALEAELGVGGAGTATISRTCAKDCPGNCTRKRCANRGRIAA